MITNRQKAIQLCQDLTRIIRESSNKDSHVFGIQRWRLVSGPKDYYFNNIKEIKDLRTKVLGSLK